MAGNDFQVAALPAARIGELEPLLKSSPFKPLRRLARELGGSLDHHWFSTIEEMLAAENALAFCISLGGDIVGMIVYTESPWETRVMGEKAASLSHFVVSPSVEGKSKLAFQLLDRALEQAQSQGVRFLSIKIYTDDVTATHALESRGFLLMDTVVDCFYDYRRSPLAGVPRPRVPVDIKLRAATLEDRAELVLVAGLAFSGHFGRFHADERIGRQTASRIYEEWIHSALDGYADWFDVAEVGDRIAGFSIWRSPTRLENNLAVRVGHYSISGIHPDFHGRGLFTALTLEGMTHLEDSVDVIEGPTHINNHGVQIGYSRLNWQVCGDARHSFHKWIDGPSG